MSGRWVPVEWDEVDVTTFDDFKYGITRYAQGRPTRCRFVYDRTESK